MEQKAQHLQRTDLLDTLGTLRQWADLLEIVQGAILHACELPAQEIRRGILMVKMALEFTAEVESVTGGERSSLSALRGLRERAANLQHQKKSALVELLKSLGPVAEIQAEVFNDLARLVDSKLLGSQGSEETLVGMESALALPVLPAPHGPQRLRDVSMP